MNQTLHANSTSWRGVLCNTKTQVRKFIAVALLTALISAPLFSQIVVTQNANGTALAQLLSGPGVTITNVVKTCDNNGSATFSNGGATNLGIGQGVVLATGRVQSISQPASSFASTPFTNSGDPQLSTLTTGSIFDKCILEFDVVPQGTTLHFNYVFASEEYPQFVCSPFNDVFGFFVTGPNPVGGSYTNLNIATLPASTTPVCINSVNDGVSGTYMGTTWNSGNCVSLTNTSLFINNTTPVINPNIVYNGMTTVLTAFVTVVPCQTYHLKIAIADVGDRLYDSGVFLQAYSVTSTPYSVAVAAHVNNPGFTSTYEGCEGGTFTVSIAPAQATPVTVNLQIGGTATNGVDYPTIIDSVIIPAGQTSATIPMNPIQDNIIENPETVIISVINTCTGLPITSDSLLISDVPTLAITVADSTLCSGQSTLMSAQPAAVGGATYAWSPATGLSNANIASPMTTPLTTTTYSLSMTLGSCVLTDAQTIYVSHPAISLAVSPSDTVCNGDTIRLTSSMSNGVIPYSYLWNTGAASPVLNASTSGLYTVTGTDAYGCTAIASKTLTVLNLSASSTVTNVLCFSGNTGGINVTVTGGSTPYLYNWAGGVTSQNRTGLASGTYNLTVTDNNLCTATISATITQPASALSVSTTGVSNVSCFGGNNGAINLTVSGGTIAYTYNWTGGVATQNRAGLTAGTYDVTVTDHNACTATAGATITQPASALSAATAVTNANCAPSTGAVNLTVTGGSAPYTFNWGGGITTQNLTGVSAGTYHVTVTDNQSCTTTASGVVTQPASTLAATATPISIGCFGAANGAINLGVTGGATPYSFNWTGGITSQNRTALGPGTYAVTVTDNNACTTTATATITEPASALSVTPTVTSNVSCFGGNNGAINLAVTGGTATYTYHWIGGVATQNRANLSAGTYDVTVTDNNACTVTATTTITQPVSALSAVPTVTSNVNCFGGNNGAINLAVTGGATPYTYNWTGGITTQNRTALVAGTYNVTVTDNNACTAIATATITQPTSALSAVPSVTSNVNCFGGNNGAINMAVTGGTTSYSYSWTGGVTTQNRALLVAGVYDVTVTDHNACTATASATITQPIAALSANAATAANVTCFGGNTGAINLTVTGGTIPYSYNWTGGITTQNRTSLLAGTYNVTVTDNNACTAIATATITQPTSALSAVPAVTSNVNCFGGNNGAINLAVTGGATPYTYNWTGGITTQNRTALVAGTYDVTVTDNNACTAIATATITQPTSALNAVPAVTSNVNCFGGNNGAINLAVTCGANPYTYNWTGGITTQNRTALVAGTYDVTVTDNNACTAIASAAITQPTSALNAIPAVTSNVNCFGGNNGAINLAVTGGTTPYAYNWTGGITTQNRTALASGTYDVTVTDNNACTALATATITQPTSALNAVPAVTSNVNCFGGNNGAINLAVTGGANPYTYNWTGGITTQNRTALVAGTYDVTVTDNNACTALASATITQPASALSAVPAVTSNVNCFGGNNGAINLAVTGGTTPYTYNWTGGITTQNRTALVAGTYNVTVTDNNACTALASATITQPASALSAVPAVTSNVNCFGGNNGAINLAVTGGTTPYSYNWTGGITTQNRTALVAGTYNVTVTDNNACTALASATITQPASALSAVPAVTSSVNCFGGNNGAINLAVTGGATPYTYNWTGGITTQNRTALVAGTYDVTVTDNNACTAIATATITQPASALSAVPAVTSNVNCFGGNNGAINLAVTGGTTPYSYNWTGGITTQNRTALVAGTYDVTITDNNACTAIATATITQPTSALSAVPSVTSNVNCFGGNNGAITLAVTGGATPYTYNWTGGITTQNRTALSSGAYNVTVTDNNACTTTATASITQPAAAFNLATAVTNASCAPNTGAIILTVTGGSSPYSFNWTGGITTQNISGLSAGTYHVTVTDNNACITTTAAIITQPASSLNASTAVINAGCFGSSTGAITLTVTGGAIPYTYNWTGGVTTQNRINLSAGVYDVTVTDNNLCTTLASAVVTQPSSALAAVAVATNVLCTGASTGGINLTVSGGTSPYTYHWTGGAATQNISAIVAGTYTVTVTDNNLCTTTATAIVTQPAAVVNANTTPTNVSCFGGNNGAINLGVTGGTPPYSYNWDGSITSQNRTNLLSGTYHVTVTDANTCSTTSIASVTQPSAAITPAPAINNNLCYGGSSGSIYMAANGGTSPYLYNWAGGGTAQNRTNLTAGNYMVTITDAAGCTADTSVSITQPAVPFNATPVITNVSCYGGSNGKIDDVISGGNPPFSYSWTGGFSTKNISGLAPGTYTLTVTDVYSCTTAMSANVVQPPSGLVGAVIPTNVQCFGSNSGAILLNASGGTPPYTYTWSDSTRAQTRNHLAAGTYQVSVTDANTCLIEIIGVISEPQPLIIAPAFTNVSCYNGSNGSINPNVSGGSTPYSFNWGGGVTSQNRTNLVAGVYNVVVTDSNTCTATATTVITQPAAAINPSSTATNVLCYAGNNGAINLAVTGGTIPYNYNWGGSITSQNRSGLVSGTYVVTITDNNGCSATHPVTITQPSAALTAQPTVTNVNCYGGSTGAINLQVNGGTSPYTFNWGSGVTTQNRTNIPVGTYAVTIMDANSCSITNTITIVQPASALNVSSSTNNVSCYNGNNGTINLTVAGGTGPYRFNWGTVTTQNRTNLAAGTYHASVTDNNGCSVLVTASVTQPASALTVNAATSGVSCYGGNNGSINLTVNGGTLSYTYNWGAGITTQNRANLSAGNYEVTVTDGNLCSAVLPVIVTQPASAVHGTANVTGVTCFAASNGAVTTTINGGTAPYSYNWGAGITTQNRSNLSAGTYTVTITDNLGCTTAVSAIVVQPAFPLSASNNITAVNCYGANTGAIGISVTGGSAPYSYNWGSGITLQNRTNLAAGVYTVTVTDIKGCTVASTSDITQPSSAVSPSVSASNVLCRGGLTGSINVSVNGGTSPYNFNWGAGITSQNRSNLSAGLYVVTVTDNLGCTITASANVTQPASGIGVSASVSPVSCFGGGDGMIQLNVNGGTLPYSYNWGGGAGTPGRAHLATGTYLVTVSDHNGCTAISSSFVGSPDSMSLNATITDPSCYSSSNGSIQLSVTGGTPAYQFAWSNGSGNQNISNLPGGSYSVTVSDAHGCNSSLNQVILSTPVQVNVSVSMTSVSCSGKSTGALVSTATGGTSPYHFQWSNSATTQDINNLAAGNYLVTITDAHGCTATGQAPVGAAPAVSADGTANPLPCVVAKGAVDISVTSGTAPFAYRWSTGASTQNINNVQPGTYHVTITDANGCKFDTVFVIDNLNSFTVNASGGATVKLGQTVDLHATSTGSAQTIFNWTPGYGLSCTECPNTVAQPGQTTLYTVTGTDTNGCSAKDTVSVDVIEDHTIFVPNAFSPNGDGNNDYFQMFGNLAGIRAINVMIFDRWGEKVFESEETDFKWDGIYKGEKMQPAVFVYVIKVNFLDGGNSKMFKGSITLVR